MIKLSNNQDIPYIGLGLTTVSAATAKEYDIPKGAYIKEVKMDSPALAAGLQSGDVITEMDGEAVYTVDSYESKLALKPGDEVEIVGVAAGRGEVRRRSPVRYRSEC